MNDKTTPISPKQDLFALCKEIANEFEGWSYTAGAFKNKALKHTDLIIHPVWSFNGLRGSIRPTIVINNKKITKIYKELIGRTNPWTFRLHHHIQRPEKYRHSSYDIFREKELAVRCGDSARYLILEQAPEFIRGVVQDGIEIIEQNYDLTSERALLENLPEEYNTLKAGRYCQLYEHDEGVKYCLARMMLGDFEYIERFYRDEIPTVWPKHKSDLEKILAALPELKQRDFKLGG